MGRSSSLAAICVLAIVLGNSHAQFREYPPRLSYSNLPETRFTCEGKLAGRYYADPETDCQMFHVCSRVSAGLLPDYRFLCPNGTVFDQEHQVCADYYQVVCHKNVGTNPLGHIFEIYKVGVKESTRAQELGTAPSSDPVYLGQNSIAEEFQAEEYNNNKLASQNSLNFGPTGKSINGNSRKSSKNDIFFYTQSTTTRRPTTSKPSTTTTRRPAPAPTAAPFDRYYETSTVDRFDRYYETSTTAPASRYYETSTTAAPASRYYETSTTRRPPPPTTTTTPRPAPTYKSTTQPSESAEKYVFSDFNSLSKFQYDFHNSFTTRKPKIQTTTDFPTTTDRYYTSTTYSPLYSEEEVNVQPNYYENEHVGTTYRTTTYFPTTYRTTTYFPTTTYKPTTTPKPLPPKTSKPKTAPPKPVPAAPKPTNAPSDIPSSSSYRPLFSDSSAFGDFKSLASFQHAFHHGFTTRAPKKSKASTTEAPSSVEQNYRAQTEAPVYQTTSTPRKQVFHSTYRANSNDLSTTVSPATFQQQPSRFNEDFFRKVENKYDTTLNSEESKYYEPAAVSQVQQRRRPVTQNAFQSERLRNNRNRDFDDEVAPSSTSRPAAAVSRRGGARRRPEPVNQDEQQFSQPSSGRQFSRRVENSRAVEDREPAVAPRERSRQSQRREEIFDTEASVFRGSPVVNDVYSGQRRQPVRERDERPVTGIEYSPALFGRRARPKQRDEAAEISPLEERPRKNERTRVIKRIRRPITTTVEPASNEVFTSTTTPEPELIYSTSKPVLKLQVRTKTFTVNRKPTDKPLQIKTSTQEPELITASDEEVERLRQAKPTVPIPTVKSPLKEKALTPFKPQFLSFKVEERRPTPTAKSIVSKTNSTTTESYKKSFQFQPKPTKKTVKEESYEGTATRSPDYDYHYYDSDTETDYLADIVARQDKYGKKPSGSNLHKS